MKKKIIQPQAPEDILKSKKAQVLSFKAKMDKTRTFADRFADAMTTAFGSTWFFVANFICFLLWILINTSALPLVAPFDPYPFGFLTMMVSLEAIFLSIFVLISQNRASKVADLREEIDLQVNVKAEHEITKILCMVDEIHDQLGLDPKDDAELRGMKKPTNLSAIEKAIAKEMDESK